MLSPTTSPILSVNDALGRLVLSRLQALFQPAAAAAEPCFDCCCCLTPFVLQGTISFPIFVLHGALGQLFYKKIVATKVWGSVMPLSFFPAYCAIVLLSAAAVQKFFLVSGVWGRGRLRSIAIAGRMWATTLSIQQINHPGMQSPSESCLTNLANSGQRQ
jgi:hypothetical protein